MKTVLFFLSISLMITYSQSLETRYSDYGDIVIAKLGTAPFPHPKRENGHTYNNQSFPSYEHYSDSTVVMFIPKGYFITGSVDLVIYFHGWWNNVDSALNQFKLIEQFSRSKKNAIFVFPEGPKNSPDSFGGKLEDSAGLRIFINEVMKTLQENGKIKKRKLGQVILAGHSGAYRVMAFSLMRSGIPEYVKEVYLFDALYGQLEKYVYWFDHFNGKLINIFTDDGGTKEQSEILMDDLKGWGIPYFYNTEDEINLDDLKNNKLIFIHSKLGHNDVISKKEQFLQFLNSSCLNDIPVFK